jgi:hypothetical protein
MTTQVYQWKHITYLSITKIIVQTQTRGMQLKEDWIKLLS